MAGSLTTRTARARDSGSNSVFKLPFGEELAAGTGGRTTAQGYPSGPNAVDGVRQKFTSKERDIETGLDYFLARYYSSAQGRFTSPDEFKGGPDELYDFADNASENPTFYADITNPQSLNKYQYTYNSPLNFTDEDGHNPIAAAAAAAAVLILLSADTTHAPRPTDRRLTRSGDGVGQLFVNAALGAVGGPIVSKLSGKVFGALTGRLGAAAERAALQAERQKIARLVHIRELGLDPAKRKFVAAEAQAGARLEAQLGRRLSREASGAVDFVEKASGRTYELLGAGLKSQHFNHQAFTRQIMSHLGKADRVVIDASKLNRAQVDGIRQYVGDLPRAQSSRIIFLR